MKKIRIFALYTFFIVFSFIAFYIYYVRLGSYSFGDEWTNFINAYFMLKGKSLYAQIFCNHQMLAAYLSFAIQKLFQPINLYKLVFYHRLFMVFWSFLIGIIIINRFRWIGMGFILFYELTKYYLFGHLFLAEGMIVYPLVFLAGIAWYKLRQIKTATVDILICGFFAWFVLFMREPYALVALIIYFVILWKENKKKTRYFSVLLFLILSFIVLASVSLPAYFSQVIQFNLKVMVPYEIENSGGLGIVKGFFYPIYIFFDGKWNHFRYVLIFLDLTFLTLASIFVFKLKRLKEIIFIILILGFSSLRITPPGTIFYEAFHMLPWYGLFIMIIFLLYSGLLKSQIKTKWPIFLATFLIAMTFFNIISFQSFLWEKVNREKLFNINYAHYFLNGEVIRTLADPKDTLFADLWDQLIHWQSGLDSPYKYSTYNFVMYNQPEYEKARSEMFLKNPPDFYYTYCSEKTYFSSLLPKDSINDYIQLYRDGKRTCLYVKKTKLSKITTEKWEKAKKLGFYLN